MLLILAMKMGMHVGIVTKAFMKNKKKFGVSVSIITDHSSPSSPRDQFSLSRDYVDAISLAGGIPMLLPAVTGAEEMKQQLHQIDVLVLSGGSDVDPLCYGEEPNPLLEAVSHERDRYELSLIAVADRMGIPIFGICRGLQILNVAFGGTLYQDTSLSDAYIAHRQRAKPHEPFHTVSICRPSLLYDIFGKSEILTNSFHHQAIKRLASGFSVNAVAKDGIIEGIERPGRVPILAVQWHPEMMAVKNPVMLELFRFFA